MGSLYSISIGVKIQKGEYVFGFDGGGLFFSGSIFDCVIKLSEKENDNIVGFRAFSIENYSYDDEKIKDLYEYQYYPENIIVHQPQLNTWMITFNEHFKPHEVTIQAKCIKCRIYKEVTTKLALIDIPICQFGRR